MPQTHSGAERSNDAQTASRTSLSGRPLAIISSRWLLMPLTAPDHPSRHASGPVNRSILQKSRSAATDTKVLLDGGAQTELGVWRREVAASLLLVTLRRGAEKAMTSGS